MSKRFNKIKFGCTTLCMQCSEKACPKLKESKNKETGLPSANTMLLVLLWFVMAYLTLDGTLYNAMRWLFKSDSSTFGLPEVFVLLFMLIYSLVVLIDVLYELYKRGTFFAIQRMISERKNKQEESNK